MPAAVYDQLDGSFAALVVERGDAFAPVLQGSGDAKTLPLYPRASIAEQRLSALPDVEVGPGPRVRVVDAGDVRAKQELLRAAEALGAASIRFDEGRDGVAPGGHEPRVDGRATDDRLSIRLALGHLEAYRRNSACL